MNHLKITQQEGMTEYCSSEVPVKIYELDSSGQLDGNSTFVGTIQVEGGYRYQTEYLTKKYNSFHINVDNYWIYFNDRLFGETIAKKINGTTHITETEANSVTSNDQLFTYVNNNDIKEVDFTPFTNLKRFELIYPETSDNRVNSVLYNLQNIDTVNFGEIEQFTFIENEIYSANFNVTAANECFANKVIAEKTKYLGQYAFRGLYFTELYLPNIIAIGPAQGNTNKQNSKGELFRRHFMFFGNNFQKFADALFTENNDENNKGIIVIAATTPPELYTFPTSNRFEGINDSSNFSYSRYRHGVWDYYVPTSAYETYKTHIIWQYMENNGKLHPFSELPEEYKQKVSKWYTE